MGPWSACSSITRGLLCGGIVVTVTVNGVTWKQSRDLCLQFAQEVSMVVQCPVPRSLHPTQLGGSRAFGTVWAATCTTLLGFEM